MAGCSARHHRRGLYRLSLALGEVKNLNWKYNLSLKTFNVYSSFGEKERQKECEQGRGRETDTHTQNLKSAPGCKLSA